MSKYTVACLLTGALWAANDPFVGKWKVNPSKSRLTDEMKVEAAGANRYAITFGPGAIDTVVADGSDQPGLGGTTLSITAEEPNKWKVVRKRQGRILLTAYWTLSADGKTLNDAFTGYQPDGSTLSLHYMYKRTAGSTGFPGTWDTVREELNSVIELEITPQEGDGLSFRSPAAGMNKKLKFDGKEYADGGPAASPASTCSGRRMNERNLEITDKRQGKVADTLRMKISGDLKTLTMMILPAGERKPKNVLVFDRE